MLQQFVSDNRTCKSYHKILEVSPAEEPADAPVTGEVLKAPMGGKVISINVKPGDKVAKGGVLLVYEAMKMENDVVAEKDVTVKRIFVKPDEVVGADAPLMEFE